MKRNNIIGYLIAFFCLLVAACEDSGLLEKEGSSVIPDNPSQPTYTLEVSPTELKNIKAEGETTPITVKSNDSWTATASDSWITLSTPNGTNSGIIDVTIAANDNTSNRPGSITIKGDNSGTKTVSISQQGKSPSNVEQPTLTVDPDYLEFQYDETANKTVTVTSNTDWTVSSSKDWIIVSVSEGKNDGLFDIYLTEENTSTDSREGTVTVEGNNGKIKREIDIKQEGKNYYINVTTSWTPSSSKDSKEFSVVSNDEWEVKVDPSTEKWLSVTKNSNSKFTATVEKNGTTQRTATIKLTGTHGTEATIDVTQSAEGVYMKIDGYDKDKAISIDADATSVSFTVESNVGWTVSKDDDNNIIERFNLESGNANKKETITVTLKKNIKTTSVSATIKVEGNNGEITRQIKITQEAKVYKLRVDTNDNLTNVSADGTTTITFEVTSNDSWSVTENSDWITIKPTSGTGNGRFTATITANSDTKERTETITVTADHDSSQKKEFTITQQGKTPDSVISIGEDYDGKDKELSHKRQ